MLPKVTPKYPNVTLNLNKIYVVNNTTSTSLCNYTLTMSP